MNQKIIRPKNLLSVTSSIITIALIISFQAISCKEKSYSVAADISQSSLKIATEKIRDSCLMLIKNVLMDSVKAMLRKDSFYKPAFSFVNYPEDSLAYSFKISAFSYSNFIKQADAALVDSTPPKPPCTCTNRCQICLVTNRALSRYGPKYVEIATEETPWKSQ
jgi:hypothetical protein